jgi:hypothetical protein
LPVAARVVLPFRGVYVHCVYRTPGSTLTRSAAWSILSFALRELGRYLFVVRGFPLLADVSTRHDLPLLVLADSFPAARALGINLSIAGTRLPARARAALALALRIDSLLVRSAALRFLALFARPKRHANFAWSHTLSTRLPSGASTLLVVPFHVSSTLVVSARVSLLTRHPFSSQSNSSRSLNIRTKAG